MRRSPPRQANARGARVAIVYDAAFPWVKGGGEKRIADLAERLSGEGLEVHLYCMKFWNGPPRIERRGVTLHGICPAMPLYTKSGRRSIVQAVYFGIACLSLAFEPFDTIDCCGFPFFSLIVCSAIAKLRRKRLISTWLEVWGDAYWCEYLGRLGPIGAFVERVCARLPDLFVSISELTTSRLIELLAVARGRIVTIPIGIDLDAIDREPRDLVESDVLYVGRLMAFKNVDLVIRAIARLRDVGVTTRLRVVGDGPEMLKLRSLVETLDIGHWVRFDGFIDTHPYSCMKSTRVLVQPSVREGFGIVAIEAMACGVPVVTVDEPENATRLLVSPETGIVTSADVESLTDALRTIVKSDRDWNIACRALAERYDWARIAGEFAAIYAPAGSR